MTNNIGKYKLAFMTKSRKYKKVCRWNEFTVCHEIPPSAECWGDNTSTKLQLPLLTSQCGFACRLRFALQIAAHTAVSRANCGSLCKFACTLRLKLWIRMRIAVRTREHHTTEVYVRFSCAPHWPHRWRPGEEFSVQSHLALPIATWTSSPRYCTAWACGATIRPAEVCVGTCGCARTAGACVSTICAAWCGMLGYRTGPENLRGVTLCASDSRPLRDTANTAVSFWKWTRHVYIPRGAARVCTVRCGVGTFPGTFA